MKKFIFLAPLAISFIALLGFDKNDSAFERVSFSLNENDWKFKKEDVKKGFKKSLKDADWLSVKIPHDFNGGSDGVNNDVFDGRFDFENDPDKRNMYKGAAWYRTQFTVDPKFAGKRVFVDFEAVSLEAKVWVNGKEVGMHQGGYTAFSFDVTDYIKTGKPNTLAVRVDNSNNSAIAPWMADEKNSFPYSFDYAIYGGIYRDVWLTITDEVKIENVLNTPVCGGQAPAVLTIETRVKNYSKEEKSFVLRTAIYDPKGKEISVLKRKKTLKAGEKASLKQSETSVGELFFWSPETPVLYRVESTVLMDGKPVDQFNSDFGFRYYTLANKQPFMLNGKKTFIRGINRHQDMEGLGYALPNEQHVKDVQLIKDAGFNFIRHAHYPCDREFAREAKEQGIMLWLEIPVTGSTSDNPLFLENAKQQLTEMIEQNYNNPAVVLWGIGNESDRSGGGEAVSNSVFGALAELSRELDPNRTVTGCNYKYKSNQALVDTYAPQDWGGWYSGVITDYKPTDLIGEYGADIDMNIRTSEVFDANKNYYAGGTPKAWSEEYGAFLHEYKASIGLARKDSFPGHCAWVAFDFASPRLGRNSNPIPYMNQKGLIMHDHKTPKDIYFLYQSLYRTAEDFPMLYIVPSTWTKKSASTEKARIWMYSNCDSVALYNGDNKLISTQIRNAGPRNDTRFEWQGVELVGDKVLAEGWYKNQIVARDTVFIEQK